MFIPAAAAAALDALAAAVMACNASPDFEVAFTGSPMDLTCRALRVAFLSLPVDESVAERLYESALGGELPSAMVASLSA